MKQNLFLFHWRILRQKVFDHFLQMNLEKIANLLPNQQAYLICLCRPIPSTRDTLMLSQGKLRQTRYNLRGLHRLLLSDLLGRIRYLRV